MFSIADLKKDASGIAQKIQESIRASLRRMRRQGAVVGLSGGVDSTVTAALCVAALGKDRVFGIMMPEGESSSDSLALARLLANQLGIETKVEDIDPPLRALGCYQRRDHAIRKVIPEYGDGWKSKIVLPGVTGRSDYAVFSVVAQSPSGEMKTVRLTPEAYLGIVAATNFKQRIRKTMEYYHADRLNYAVAGTPNRLEYAQGFFVKNGDGSADFKPIAHLYKTQVYEVGRYLKVPDEILRRTPTTDTYSLEQTQEEFFFALPLQTLDICLYGKNNGLPLEEVAAAANLSVAAVQKVYAMIDSKLSTTRYLHMPPQLVEPIPEVQTGDKH